MIYFTHENFPAQLAEILRRFEFFHEIQIYSEHYPPGEATSDWVTALGNQSRNWRPVILMFDDGIKGNRVTLEVMKQSRCTFVVLSRRWSKTPWDELAPLLLTAWKQILVAVDEAEHAHRQCRIDVVLSGKAHIKVFVTNL